MSAAHCGWTQRNLYFPLAKIQTHNVRGYFGEYICPNNMLGVDESGIIH